MTSSLRISIVLGLLVFAPVVGAHASYLAAPSVLAQDAKPERYVRTNTATKVLNLPAKQGVSIASLPSGSLLAVYGERSGWLNVEAPQGMQVWVYGEYLRPTSQPGIAEVTGDNVHMRPLPASSQDSYALEQKLHEGDRVRVLGRNDASKPLDKDWVRIVTPPGTRGWVAAADTGVVEAGVDTRAAWNEASKKSMTAASLYDLRDNKTVSADATPAFAKPESSASDAGKSAATPAASSTKPDAAPAQGSPSQGSWEAAERAYDAAKTAEKPNWAAVRGQFERYLAQNPNGASASTAKLRLDQIGIHEEIARLKSDAALQEVERKKLLAIAQAQLDEASLSQDPLWGRFQARGWLRRDENEPGRFIVQWGGRTAAEVTCGSGRYDLALLAGAEIGIMGAMTRGAGSVDRPMRIDATKIEIISAPTGR